MRLTFCFRQAAMVARNILSVCCCHSFVRGTTELRPPSTPIVCPVIHLFSGFRSHVIALATSSGVPGRPIACSWDEAARDASDSQIFRVSFDLIRPGATAFTRTPRPA